MQRDSEETSNTLSFTQMIDTNLKKLSITPLSSDQYANLSALVQSIDNQQATWLAGYFSGLSAQSFVETSDNKQTKVLTILYGSLTGKGEEIATLAATKAKQHGLEVNLQDMANFSANDLMNTHNLLVVVSTHGKGAPPFPAKGLHDYLFSNRAPSLKALNYVVLALGDSSYDDFCKTGIDFDQQLEKLGATKLSPLHMGDVDIDSTAPTWLDITLPLFESGKTVVAAPAYSFLKKSNRKQTSVSFVKNSHFVPSKLKKPLPNKSNPYSAAVLEKYNLHGEESSRQTIHIELEANAPGLSFQPGDSAGVIPYNHPNLIREVLDTTGFDPTEKLVYKEKKCDLMQHLRESVELSKLTLDVIKKYLELAPLESLLALTKDREALAVYLKGRDIVDLLTDHPIQGLTPETFLSVLRPLQPRYYSISSSPLEAPGKMHLTVGVVTFENAGRTRNGTCSNYLSDVRIEDEHIPVFIEPNTHFRLPENPSIPIIMMAAGTGIAPFRAFVQHRAHSEHPGKSWLFFGNRVRNGEFLYEKEWNAHLDSGVLTRMDAVFSHEGHEKKYVQHCLKEQAADVFQWIEDGAHLYLCGSMSGFATDVQLELVRIIAEHGGRSKEDAEAYLDEMQYSGRFQMDVY